MCINNFKTPIITDNSEEERCWTILADMEARLNVIEADQAKVRTEIALELKYSEEDLAFMKNLNSQMEACLSH
jgi:hypothetical protein